MGYLVLDENCYVVPQQPCSLSSVGGFILKYAHATYPLYKIQPDLFDLFKFDQLQDGEKFQFESQLSHFHVHIQVQKLKVPHLNADFIGAAGWT